MTIVCGTDLSELSLDAVTTALAVATRRHHREVVLVNVLDEELGAGDALAAAARERLDADASRLAQGTDLSIRGEVIVGHPVDALLAASETEGGDLLVVSSKGRTNAPLIKLGGTSGAVVAASATPVLVVRDSAPFVAWAAGERPLRVMIGLDDSASCEPAIELLRELRTSGPVDVVIGHVYYADEAARRYGLRAQSLVDADPELERLLARDLIRQLGPLPGEGLILARPWHGLGRIGDHLLEIADSEKVDVVIIGTRGRHGLGRLSSVSSLVLHDAKQSVWCVPGLAHRGRRVVPRFQTAVVATDLSEFGNHAISYGYTLVGEQGGHVHLVHVRDPDDESDVVTLEEQLRSQVPPDQAGVTTSVHVVAGDDPARAIGEAAERLGADVVVIASRGRSGLTRVLLGSVADKLLRTCRRPVLVLRPPVD